jgi:SAM-dependent methyltransferase
MTPLTKCRCCNSENLTTYLDLGMMPLANNLADTKEAAINAERYPLQVMFCNDCSLSQLSVIIDPTVLFSNYTYRSGMSKGYRDHCKEMAETLQEQYGFNDRSFMIDIAGNDGTLISEFQKVITGIHALNVDPASNMIEINKAAGVRQYTKFWSMMTALELKSIGWEGFDLITATNVFAHVHDVKDFILGCKHSLNPDGVLVLEFPYLIDFIEKGEWDTVYFEHLSYWSITPLFKMLLELDMKIINVTKHDIHGGTVRVEIARMEANYVVNINVHNYLAMEANEGYCTVGAYKGFQRVVQEASAEFLFSIMNLYPGKVVYPGNVAAFAASAKGNTLLNCTQSYGSIRYIVDETPEKIGKFSPGTGIEIVPLAHLINNPVDYLIILSWNFADEIMSKCRAAGYKGALVIPIPTWKIVT